jgi:putative flippase GtrA
MTSTTNNKSHWLRFENFVRFVLTRVFHLFHKELSDDTFETFMQFVRFGIVGLSNTVVSYVLYAGFLLLFQHFGLFPGTDYILAQVIQFFLSVLWSFYWNNRMVFKLGENEHRSILKSLIKTYVSYAFTGLFLSSVLLIFWVEVLHISEFIAPIINICICVPINFLINKYWAFKKE